MKFNHMTDVRVEVQVPTAGLQNLVKNPDGAQGGFGWETPSAGTALEGNAGVLDFYVSVGGGGPVNVRTELMPITAGRYAVARLNHVGISAGNSFRWRFEWYNASRVYISSSAQSGAITTAGIKFLPAVVAPAGTAYFKLRIDLYAGTGTTVPTSNPGVDSFVQFNEAMAATSATSTGFGSTRVNLFTDPQGTSATSWTPLPGFERVNIAVDTSIKRTGTSSIRLRNDFYGTSNLSVYVQSGGMPVTAGLYYTASVYARNENERLVSVAQQFYVDGAWQAATYTGTPVQTLNNLYMRPSVTVRAPEGATQVRMVFAVRGINYLEVTHLDNALVEQTNLVDTYFDGGSTNSSNLTHAWSGTADASTSTRTVASGGFDYQPPYAWLPITGSITNLEIDRAEMAPGLLSVELRNESLDPAGAYDPILKMGKYVRVLVRHDDHGTEVWMPKFTGKITNAGTRYIKPKNGKPSYGLISINAADALSDLSQQTEPRSVATVAGLPYIMEGKGVPWNCDGVTSHILNVPAIPVLNENLSVADQILLTRDSVQGHAFVDGAGVMQVWTNYNEAIGPGISDVIGTDINYTEINIDYDWNRVINQVSIKHLTTGADGNAVEVVYPTYEDTASVVAYGARKKEFVVVGTSPNITALASSILTRNATPAVRTNNIRTKVRTDSELFRANVLELCKLVYVQFEDREGDTRRITSISHQIDDGGYFIDVSFAAEGSSAVPQKVDTPPVDDTALTNTGWIDIAFTPGSGWANYGGGWQAGQYRRRDGIVYLRGLVAGAPTVTTPITTLPAGFRPPASVMFTVHGNLGARRLDVGASGTVVQSEGGNTAFVSLDGVYFSV